MTEPKRYVDRRGWLRNRRAIVAGTDGLTVERWVGSPRQVAWGDLCGLSWRGPKSATLSTLDGAWLTLDAGLDAFEELTDHILAEAQRTAASGICADDISRWLGPPRTFAGHEETWERLDGVRSDGVGVGCLQLTGMAVVAALLAVAMLLVTDLSASLQVVAGCLLALVGPAVAALSWGLLMGAADGPWRRLTAVKGTSWRVVADHETCQIEREGLPAVVFRWAEVTESRCMGRWQAALDDGRTVALPAFDDVDVVVEVLRRVESRRLGFVAGARPALSRGLSPADAPVDPDRGLSCTTAAGPPH
ncbi:MAG: hypothetical protein HZB16_04710 [Armatimonadetes bacterium]|nr:hypothetical protein [Armatimonadota bacterium]